MDTEALNKLKALEDAAQTAATDRERIAALDVLAREQWAHGLTISLATAQQARQLASGSGSPACLVRSLCTEGYLCYHQSRNADAQVKLREALALIQGHADLEGRSALEAECRHFLGLVHYGDSAYEPALEQFLQVQALYREGGDRGGLGQILNDLGNLYSNMGDAAGALSCYRDSLERRRANGDRRGVACSLNNIGNIHAEMQDEAQALLAYEQCLAAARETNYVRLEMRCLANMAPTYAGMNRWEEAFESSRTALELARAGGHRDNEGLALSSWADTHKCAGQPERAVPLYQAALRIAQEAEDKRAECQVQAGLGECFLATGQLGAARHALASAAEMTAVLDYKAIAFRAFLGLSEVCRQESDFKQALEFHQKFHAVQQEVLQDSAENRTRTLLIQMQVEQVHRDAEIDRRQSVALAGANAALEAANDTLRDQARRMEALARDMERLAAEDGLTGLANRRHLESRLARHFSEARRLRRPLSVAMADVDHFKQINDLFGHQVGDEVLMSIGLLLRQACRLEDLAARYGGEEFVLVLPETDLSGASLFCERLRRTVEEHPWQLLHPSLSVTVSMGLSESEDASSYERLLGQADAQLYAAKHAGRNCVFPTVPAAVTIQ